MKIKVVYERVFDSNEFYIGADPEELEALTFDQFSDEIADYLNDGWDIIDEMDFEELKEDDSK